MNQRSSVRFWIVASLVVAALATMAAFANPRLGPEGVLFVLIQAFLALNWPVAGILWWGVWRGRGQGDGPALTVMAVAATLIASILTVYVLVVVNSGAGYFLPREAAQFLIRSVFLGLALFPIWFLWLFLTGGFREVER